MTPHVCQQTRPNRVVDIIALGLRNLAPYNMLPIHNPFMEFDAGDQKHQKATRASHVPSGANPNFVEHIRLPITLPANPLYAPALNIRVRDTRLGGFSKPTIGTCSVPLAALIPDADGTKPPELHRARAADGNPFVVEVRRGVGVYVWQSIIGVVLVAAKAIVPASRLGVARWPSLREPYCRATVSPPHTMLLMPTPPRTKTWRRCCRASQAARRRRWSWRWRRR